MTWRLKMVCRKVTEGKIRGDEWGGQGDSGSELSRGKKPQRKPLWPKHPSCSCYCDGKILLTSPADVKPASWAGPVRGWAHKSWNQWKFTCSFPVEFLTWSFSRSVCNWIDVWLELAWNSYGWMVIYLIYMHKWVVRSQTNVRKSSISICSEGREVITLSSSV